MWMKKKKTKLRRRHLHSHLRRGFTRDRTSNPNPGGVRWAPGVFAGAGRREWASGEGKRGGYARVTRRQSNGECSQFWTAFLCGSKAARDTREVQRVRNT